MAQTTVTTLATTIPQEFILATVLQEARPFNVLAPLILNDVLPQGVGSNWFLPKLPTTTAYTIAEGSDLGAAARTTTEATIAVSEVGLSTEVTQLAMETSKLQNQLGVWASSQGRAIAQLITSDIGDLFVSLNDSTAVGTSGTNLTVANFTEAMYTLDSQDAPGQRSAPASAPGDGPVQRLDAASSAPLFSNLAELIRDGRLPQGQPAAGFVGELFGVPIYSTTEVPTGNGAADRVGAMFVREAMGFIQLRPIQVKYDEDISKRSTEVVVTAVYGVGEIEDNYGVPIETDA